MIEEEMEEVEVIGPDEATPRGQSVEGVVTALSEVVEARIKRGIIRISLGLALFGLIWHFYSWGKWLFWGYAIVAPLLLGVQIWLFRQLAGKIGEIESMDVMEQARPVVPVDELEEH